MSNVWYVNSVFANVDDVFQGGSYMNFIVLAKCEARFVFLINIQCVHYSCNQKLFYCSVVWNERIDCLLGTNYVQNIMSLENYYSNALSESFTPATCSRSCV